MTVLVLVGVLVGVAVRVGVLVTVAVRVGVTVRVAVLVAVAVAVGVEVRVGVIVGVCVLVGVGVTVTTGFGSGGGTPARLKPTQALRVPVVTAGIIRKIFAPVGALHWTPPVRFASIAAGSVTVATV